MSCTNINKKHLILFQPYERSTSDTLRKVLFFLLFIYKVVMLDSCYGNSNTDY